VKPTDLALNLPLAKRPLQGSLSKPKVFRALDTEFLITEFKTFDQFVERDPSTSTPHP